MAHKIKVVELEQHEEYTLKRGEKVRDQKIVIQPFNPQVQSQLGQYPPYKVVLVIEAYDYDRD